MRRILLLALAGAFFAFSGIKAQIYKGEAIQMLLLNQPDARTEAMGRGSAALGGSPFMNIFNPAASSLSAEGASTQISHLEFTFLYGVKANYDTYGAGVNLGKFGALGFNFMHFSWGFKVMNTGENLISLAEPSSPYSNIYSINYSRNIFEGLKAGINLNYFDDESGRLSRTAWTLDAGLMNKLTFGDAILGHELTLGLSFSNVSNSKIKTDVDNRIAAQFILGRYENIEIEEDSRDHVIDLRPYYLPGEDITGSYLPSAMRLAAAYEIRPGLISGNFRLISAIISAQYQDLLNSKYFTRYSFGAEIKILEMLSLRGGWLKETRDNMDFYRFPKSVEGTTYGFGVELPVGKVISSSLPLMVKFDQSSIANGTVSSMAPYVGLKEGKRTLAYTLNVSYNF
ncbi:MAG: hypothetical protein HF314_09110 [Ignavibacteria bacterium]|nr:hypothetical protein [Ignavibacteria bacterium]MCU7503220.1 hypothetical protein [Ignavibacteria bacterium]MCU7518216.1 hypothetical protein [Ignavibacteria bacterium]